MWVRRAEWDQLVAERAAAQAEARQLAARVSELRAILVRQRAVAKPPPPAPVPTLDDIDGLTPAIRDAIREFAGTDAAVARHLADEARRRLLAIRRLPEAQQDRALAQLVELLREGETYTGRLLV